MNLNNASFPVELGASLELGFRFQKKKILNTSKSLEAKKKWLKAFGRRATWNLK
jgi:hypothetical protein